MIPTLALAAALPLLLAPPALAANPVFCTRLSELQNKVQSCEQNDYFAEAGVLCLEAFESHVQAASGAIRLAAAAEGQSQAIGRTATELEKAKLVVAGLIIEGSLRIREIVAYTRNISLPEDADNPEIVGPDVKKFLQGSQCYKRAAGVLESNMEIMDKHLKSLKRTQKALIQAASEARARAGGLDSPAKGAASATRGKGGGAAARTGKEKRSTSDVTGAEEAVKKDAKKP